jgi:hypothetical protein
VQTKIRPCRGIFFSKLINVQTEIRPFTKDGIDVQGEFFGTLEYMGEARCLLF